jgi:hypothetical protein
MFISGLPESLLYIKNGLRQNVVVSPYNNILPDAIPIGQKIDL